MTKSISSTAIQDRTVQLQHLYSAQAYISYAEVKNYRQSVPRYRDVFRVILSNPAEVWQLYQNLKSLKLYKKLTSESERYRHNNSFIASCQARAADFVVESRPLDRQQIEAVVALEDAQLVMAAAGSGKTLSLLGKCQYLVNDLGVPGNKILAISFTNSSAAELNQRLSKLGIDVVAKTFHALGNDILHLKQSAKVITNNEHAQLLTDVIEEKLKIDNDFARQYNNYLLTYYTAPLPLLSIPTMQRMVQYNRSFQAQTLKRVSTTKSDYGKNLLTAAGEKVRSKEEQIIANYLYINNINYEYEKPFKGYSNYKPDFTILEFGEPIYLEHQGVDRHNQPRLGIDRKEYQQKMAWNRQYHHNGRTRFIETFSYEFQEGTILQNLEKRLLEEGVQIIRREESQIRQIINDSYGNDVREFNKLLGTYVGLIKTSEYSLASIKQQAVSLVDPYQRLRTQAFLALIEPIFNNYNQSLRANNKIDFADMIVQSARLLPTLAPGKMEFDYILVDEVQDLSPARYQLLKALLDRNPLAKLFAVGDDWQSIFRFAGSDITLLRDFENKFQRYTRRSVIEQTHRFSNPLLNLTSDFIKKNPLQVQKDPYSLIQEPSYLNFNGSASYSSDATALDVELRRLVEEHGQDGVCRLNILLLSRYSRDVNRLLNTADPRLPFRAISEDGTLLQWTDSISGLKLSLPFKTMHASKGLTCDYGFILNANGGSMGLPADRDDDPVVKLLLAHQDDFEYAEERRLFYVAMTRAKKATTIIYNSQNPSPFLVDLIKYQKPKDGERPDHCPQCQTGSIVLRHSPYGDFYGCTNYSFGCRYTYKKT